MVMRATGAVFQPELIELMKAVLDDAAALLPEAKRTSAVKAEIASCILARAAQGERDPKALRRLLFWQLSIARIIRTISHGSAVRCDGRPSPLNYRSAASGSANGMTDAVSRIDINPDSHDASLPGCF
jgi:hypothetical protein